MSYERWADLYDAFYQRALGKDYAAETAYVVQRIIADHGPNASVLDVACGTGMHLSLMPSTFTLAGVDREPRFLEIAKARAPRAALSQGLMQELTVASKVDAITCMFSAIGHLPDVSALRKTAKRFAAALMRRGTVIVEPWVLPEEWRLGFLHMLAIDENDLKAVRTSSSERTGNKTTIHYAFAVSDKRGSRAFEETDELTLFSDHEYREALTTAGFRVEREVNDLFKRGLYIGRLP